MTDREKEILRMGLLYLLANLSDVVEFFSECDCAEGDIEVNGEQMAAPTDKEICDLLWVLQ